MLATSAWTGTFATDRKLFFTRRGKGGNPAHPGRVLAATQEAGAGDDLVAHQGKHRVRAER